MDWPARLVLLGHPVTQSISPRFQNAALQAAGIALSYSTLDVAPTDLDAVLTSLAHERAAGNVTIPHKEAMAARCARLTPLAERCGAVNVFWHEDGLLVGDNSDVGGVEMMLRALLGDSIHGSRIAVVGAGGAAASVLCAAERCGVARVQLYNRHRARAASLCARFVGLATVAGTLESAVQGCGLIVNATPVGMHDEQMPVPIPLLPAGAKVFDLIHRRDETPWVRAARAAGHLAADGEGMLLEQGVIAFERWFGIVPDRKAMRTAMR